MTSAAAGTRDRLLEAARELFARQGYAYTSIADIQQACGLSPGSGALYKHFPSKRALLQEATRRQVEQMGSMRDDYHRTRPTDVQGALRQGAEQIWAGLDDNSCGRRRQPPPTSEPAGHWPSPTGVAPVKDPEATVGQPRRLANRQRAW